ncbi:CPBP family intramembrane metalloprotease [uncultured Chryseobacterium sp.]|uniref:CPBP family intramembrane glutamic endopeptidase n=1 Tax=uncultured Chryseobacterium sp. TaxID=259322 RepID=UPI0026003402|nr:CPBP family intramembrane metalloprotease [uncultured Chryseobacterium sp.]
MNKTIRFFLIFILGFSIYYFFDLYSFKTIQNFVKETTGSKAIAHATAYVITLIPLLITQKILAPEKKITFLLSLDKSILKGGFIAFIGTLPMLIGYLYFFNIVQKVDVQSLFINTISSAFFEEIIFRAFLIGTLFRLTRLGFISALLFGSLLFAQAHLYQSNDTTELIEIFLITFLGSALFSWVYIETDFNLWTAIFLHFFMNIYWEIFNVAENVSGNWYGNVFKALSVLLIIALSIYRKQKGKTTFQITAKNLFIKTELS